MPRRLQTALLALLAGSSGCWAADAPAIGMSVGSLGHPFFTAAIAGAKAAAARIDPAATLTTVSSEWDLTKQDGQIDTFLSAGDNLILVNAADPKAIAPAVKRAQAAGIVVAAFDVAAQGADITVMTDNKRAGAMACEALSGEIGAKGRVAIVGGPSVSSVIDRVSGCREALAAHSGIEVIYEGQNPGAGREGGFAAMQAYMTRFPDIQGVFTINDEQAIGADLAAKQIGRSEMKIASVDGSPEVVSMLRAGGSRIVATAAQDPFGMGFEAVQLAWAIKGGRKPEQPVHLLEPTLVTASNAATVEGWPQRR